MDREVAHPSRLVYGAGYKLVVRGFEMFSARRVNERTGKRGACGGAAIASASFATRQRWIAFALTSRIILRSGRMTLTTSRERRLPRDGGFETRPYKSPDLCAPRE
jgi:hypothetical protein